MKLNELFTDDEAVSPVIGVILMVAITVILAAVIATFVLGLGEQVSQSAPSASFATDFTDEGSADTTEDWVNFTHESGDSIKAGTLSVSSDTGIELAHSDNSDLSSDTSHQLTDFSGIGTDSQISAGFSFSAEGENNELNSATIRIIWKPSGGGDSATIKKWEGPDA